MVSIGGEPSKTVQKQLRLAITNKVQLEVSGCPQQACLRRCPPAGHSSLSDGWFIPATLRLLRSKRATSGRPFSINFNISQFTLMKKPLYIRMRTVGSETAPLNELVYAERSRSEFRGCPQHVVRRCPPARSTCPAKLSERRRKPLGEDWFTCLGEVLTKPGPLALEDLVQWEDLATSGRPLSTTTI